MDTVAWLSEIVERLERLEKKIDRLLRFIEPKHVTDKALKK